MAVSFCRAQSWDSVKLTRHITHPQPMTGLVLWPEQAKNLDATYGKAIQLEFSYCLPCKVVTGCDAEGNITYDWSWFERLLDDVSSRGHQLIARLRVTNEGIAPLYRDAWFAIGDIRSATTLRGLLPGEERTIEIPAAVSADGSSLHIVSSHILPEQEIEFEADIRN